ncbi:hypothetical protein ACWEO4_44500 [Streptomyces sp. NPDC004393]
MDPQHVASDMGDLAARVRSLMALQQQRVLQLPLGGNFFDIVVTAGGAQAYAAMKVMDGIQHTGNEQPDACGPVIEDPHRSWLIWLVPPGTSEQWGGAPACPVPGPSAPHRAARDDDDGAARPLLAAPLPG